MAEAAALLDGMARSFVRQRTPKRPQLNLRATPRMAMSPVEVLVIGQLMGGSDLEELYCPGQEWDWGDGTRCPTGARTESG